MTQEPNTVRWIRHELQLTGVTCMWTTCEVCKWLQLAYCNIGVPRGNCLFFFVYSLRHRYAWAPHKILSDPHQHNLSQFVHDASACLVKERLCITRSVECAIGDGAIYVRFRTPHGMDMSVVSGHTIADRVDLCMYELHVYIHNIVRGLISNRLSSCGNDKRYAASC